MRRPLRIVIVLVGLLAIGGLSYYRYTAKSDAGLVSMDQLPAGFLETAHQQLPQVKFDKAWKLANGNYEIRGKDAKGKVREVELNSKGEVVEVD